MEERRQVLAYGWTDIHRSVLSEARQYVIKML